MKAAAQEGKGALPTVLVVLGATGDLMRAKIAPSLFRLWGKGLLPSLFQVVGFSKDALTAEQFRERVAGTVPAQEEVPARFLESFLYQQGLFEEDEAYERVAELLGRKDKEWRVCSNKLFYLAVPPQFYETIFKKLDSSGLTEPCSPEEGWTRVIVEKPFGKDLKTAQDLDQLLGKLFREEQIYRMDHYLGKETVQNILAFRFSNSFLDPAWNRKGISSIHVRLLERKGIGDRGGFYDGVGALRDVGQNHVLQLLALFTMDTPKDFGALAIRRKKAEVLSSLKPPGRRDVERLTLRGQYAGYLQEKNVAPDSATETYFRLQTELTDSRWKGVPIILESGKNLPEDRVEVEIAFRHPAPCLCSADSHYQNVLHYWIQPEERVEISMGAKKPGPEMVVQEKKLSFDYREAFQDTEVDAYERLLLNAVQGDQTSFVSTEEVEAEWKFVDPIVRAWQEGAVPLHTYAPQSSDILEEKLLGDDKR